MTRITAAIPIGVLGAAACVAGCAQDAAGPGATVASVTVAPQPGILVVGETVQLSATLRDAGGQVLSGRPIAWTSQAPATATVDSNGLVWAAGPGRAVAIATSEGVSGTAKMEVRAPFILAALSAGYGSTCGLTSTGEAYCWGFNAAGSLGNGSTSNSSTPVAVAGGWTFKAVATGIGHSCGLTSGGAAFCWGWNRYGQLGDSTLMDRTTPVAVSGGLSFSGLANMLSAHSCATTSGGTAFCWGQNEFGQLGIATATGPEVCAISGDVPPIIHTCSTIPVAVAGGFSITALATGGEHSCGLTAAGAAYCWGYNKWGQLGLGTSGPQICYWSESPYDCSTTPVAVSGSWSFSTLTLGRMHSCGLTSAGEAYCWGVNMEGELGNGTGASGASAPVAVAGGLRFTTLDAGDSHTCGVTIAGVAYCWGAGYGGTPVPVSVVHRFTTLAAGGGHTCGLTSFGAAFCWGNNFSGELGNGSLAYSSVPLPVTPPKASLR